jgi:hypothetical protein
MAINILRVAPKDFYVTLEISLTGMKQLVRALDLTEINYDGQENPEDKLAVMFLTKEFYPSIKEVVVDLDKEFADGP